MAIIQTIGFDTLTSNTQMDLMFDYRNTNGNFVDSTGGIKGGNCINPNNSTGAGDIRLSKNFSAIYGAGAGNEIYHSFWVKFTFKSPSSNTDGDFFAVSNVPINTSSFSGGDITWSSFDATTTTLRLVLRSDNLITIYRGSTLIATGTAVMALNTWYWIEFKAVIDGTSGVAEVRVDEVVDATFSGDTYNAGVMGITSFAFMANNSSASGVTYLADDLIINDNTGSYNNGYPGKSLIATLLPTAAGSVTQGTPSSGNNYQRVNETTQDGNTSYVDISTVNFKDTYIFADLPGGVTTVKGATVSVVCRATGSTTRKTRPQIISGSATTFSTQRTAPQGATFKTVQSAFDEDPGALAAWTVSSLNAAQFGFSLSA